MTLRSGGVVIRPATRADVELLAALGSRIFVDTFGTSNTPENMHAYVSAAFSHEQMQREIDDVLSTVLIYESGGEPIGYARTRAGSAPEEVNADKPLELVRLYIDQAHHGSGAAAAMMERCIEAARDGGHDVLWLGVWEHNPRAQAFYRKWGFERVGTQRFRLGEDDQTDWVMARRI